MNCIAFLLCYFYEFSFAIKAAPSAPQNSGYFGIKIFSLNTIIEAKCTRTSTNLKKLTEEIEADIVHYKADYIFFYIYDKEKIIKDRHAFESNFNRSFDGKEVRIIILQPVNM